MSASNVAPHVGAWIETPRTRACMRGRGSHPTWVRGLKHNGVVRNQDEGLVAPHVGAWIETFFVETKPVGLTNKSHPHVGACVSLNTILTLLKHHFNAVLIA